MKNVKHWKLIGALAALLLVFAAIKIFRSPRLERNLPDRLVTIDSSKVSELIIRPAKEMGAEIRLKRTANKWEITNHGRMGRLEQGGGLTAMSSLMNLRPERMVTRKKERWDEFGVGDSTGTHVTVMNGKDVEADVWIGSSGYNQGTGSAMSISGYTYMRKNAEADVYTISGFLESQFNRGFADWLDKTYMRVRPDSITKISFTYPADSSFVIERKGGGWTSGIELVDSVAVKAFLQDLAYKNLSKIVEAAPAGNPQATITFEGRSGVVAKLEAWPLPSGPWILRSSFQPATFFSSEGSEILKDVWVGKRKFIPAQKKN